MLEKANSKILANLAEMAKAQAREADASRRETTAPAAAPADGQAMSQPALRFAKNALNGGEIGPELYARFDQPRFQTGCHELLNMVPLPTGGVTKRPGFEYMGHAAGDTGRLLPFVFAADQARMLEFFELGEKTVGLKVWFEDGSSHLTSLRLPWEPGWLSGICFCQSADVLFCAHPKFRPMKIMRYADDDWRAQTIKWKPTISPPEWAWVGSVGSMPEGDNRRVSVAYVATSVDAETGAESEPCKVASLWGIAPLSDSYFVRLIVKPVDGASEYRFYKREAGVFGFIGRATEAEPTGEYVCEDKNIGPDTEDTPPNWKDPFAEQNPAIVFLHQQRLGFAASDERPLTVWLSQAGNYESMAASLPPNDDDAIEVTLAASRANRVLWAVSDRTGLILGTAGGEWELASADGAALAPGNVTFAPQSSRGSQPGLAPLAANAILFVQRGGRVVRELAYSYQDDRYNAVDLSLLARHVLKDSPVIAWTWQPEPLGVAWMVTKNGGMIGLTYLREHDVVAWHRHETPGKFLDCAAIPDSDGSSALWVIVSRDNVRYIERMASFDSLYHYDGRAKAAFGARVTPCLPDSQLGDGSSFTRVRKLNNVKFAVLNSGAFHVRVNSQDLPPTPNYPVPPRDPGFRDFAFWATPLAAGYRENPRLEIVADGPNPLTILGLVVTIELAEEAGAQK